MKTVRWITIASVVTFSATLAFAAPHGGRMGGQRGRHGHEFGQRAAAKLNLTDAQKQQIGDLQKGFRQKNKVLFEHAHALHKDFREARKAGDTAKLESIESAMDLQREQMKQLREAHHQEILALLTPEQRTQWKALKAEREERRAEWGRHRN